MYAPLGAPEPEAVEGVFPIGADPRAQLYADVPEAIAEPAVSGLVDQRHQSFADRVTRAAWRTVPSVYVITERRHPCNG